MVAAPAELTEKIERHLSLAEDWWTALPGVEHVFPSWDPATQLDFLFESAGPISDLRSLHRFRESGLLSERQLRRLLELDQTASRNQAILDRLWEG